MATTYFLSIHAEHAWPIIRGEKRWEFRRAEGFMVRLGVGDELLLVATYGDGRTAEVVGTALITALLDPTDMHAYFGDSDTMHWREAGCDPNTERDWAFFQREVLEKWTGAIGLEARPLVPPRPVSDIRNLTTDEPWRGTGFVAVEDLHRYGISGQPLAVALGEWLGRGVEQR